MSERRVLMEGSHAIAEAALQAGCRFYAGYPITPSTEILEYMSHRLAGAFGGADGGSASGMRRPGCPCHATSAGRDSILHPSTA